MPQFARFDPTIPEPQPVTGWFDTSIFAYVDLPPADHLCAVTPDVWTEHMTGFYAVSGGQVRPLTPPPPVLSTQQQAQAMLFEPVTVVCTSIAALDGSYPIDATTQTQITGIASAINGGLGLPGGGTTFNWPDAAGQPHQWPATQFLAFAKAVMNFVYACAQAAQGHSSVLPSQTLTIP